MTSSLQEPPLVDVKVTNPVTYLRLWWDRVMGKEGIDFRFTIHPITAFLIAFGFGAAAFGIGRYSVNIPFLGLQVIASPTPKESAETWKETAYIGTLKHSNETDKYFLVTSSASEAITLTVPPNIDLSVLVEKRIMVVGKYSKSLRVIQIFDAKDMEILPKSPNPVPTTSATTEPTLQPTTTPEATASATPIE